MNAGFQLGLQHVRAADAVLLLGHLRHGLEVRSKDLIFAAVRVPDPLYTVVCFASSSPSMGTTTTYSAGAYPLVSARPCRPGRLGQTLREGAACCNLNIWRSGARAPLQAWI